MDNNQVLVVVLNRHLNNWDRLLDKRVTYSYLSEFQIPIFKACRVTKHDHFILISFISSVP